MEDIRIRRMLDTLIGKEGGYSNNPNDAGAETMWGITIKVARLNGYTGKMYDMSREQAEEIYMREYFVKPGFDRVLLLAPLLTEKLFDIGVNMGTGTAGKFLQRALNLMNKSHSEKLYPELVVDGQIGPGTLAALTVFLRLRRTAGERVLLRVVTVLQGARYVEITEAREQNEEFIFGWFENRIHI